ncbi:MAG: UDP-N-acetylglucosamine 2-epimerase (non-hydrolyzing) [Bacteroidota bacterium]|nr:UDP-N-acetylglucosamine 2-epimerase (non-hydrolyzing) [Bacteroidota bacterium]
MKIVSIVGARPQFIKAATVSRVIRETKGIQEILLHTGQHYDENMSEVFFRELDIPEPVYNLEVGSGSHAVQTGLMLKGIEEVLLKEKPDWTLIYGDTNSTLAGALASVKLHIPVAHVEAGLRSFNRDMPEEINRIVADRVGDLLFAPTPTAMKNLENEGLASISCFTGDVMFDSILYYSNKITREPSRYKSEGIPSHYYLATVHRAENTDDPERLNNILKAFSEIQGNILLPLHPRTRKAIAHHFNIPSNVKVIEPVGYLEMLKLTMDSEKVLTDSGGLQKEAYFLGKPCITLRTETEWIETLNNNQNIITGTDPDKILKAVAMKVTPSGNNNEFGDGNAAGAILKYLFLSR